MSLKEGMRKILLTIILCIVVLVAATAVIVWGVSTHTSRFSKNVACTLEAKVCPDGTTVGRMGPNCEFPICPSTNTIPMTDTSTWKIYSSAEFGFSFKYPSTWQVSADILSVADPHITFGNPLNGMTTYDLDVFVLSNPQNMSVESFVHQILTNDAAQDAINKSHSPQITPQFNKQYPVTVDGYQGYELYGVFAHDENDEQIYVQQNKQILEFVFPVSDVNPNLANVVANNAVAHQIVDTLKLEKEVWKFCGGIAAFQCSVGYSCKLDGNFPDAGGHCVLK